ncbi:MAG: hypothetical protein CM15mP14_4560 [Rhodospirillaceae bacterium]|nr:MAG: hypothetical protein CM15mP14_4560 [Rhodospirillaceae bacterium]
MRFLIIVIHLDALENLQIMLFYMTIILRYLSKVVLLFTEAETSINTYQVLLFLLNHPFFFLSNGSLTIKQLAFARVAIIGAILFKRGQQIGLLTSGLKHKTEIILPFIILG